MSPSMFSADTAPIPSPSPAPEDVPFLSHMDPVIYTIWALSLCKGHDAVILTAQRPHATEEKRCPVDTMSDEPGARPATRSCALFVVAGSLRVFQLSLSVAQVVIIYHTLSDFSTPLYDAVRPWQTELALSTAVISCTAVVGLSIMQIADIRTAASLGWHIGMELVITILWAVVTFVLSMFSSDEVYDMENDTAAALRNPSVAIAAAAAVLFFFSPFVTTALCQYRLRVAKSREQSVELPNLATRSKWFGFGATAKSESGHRDCESRHANGASKEASKVRDFAHERARGAPVHFSSISGSETPAIRRSIEDFTLKDTDVRVVSYSIDPDGLNRKVSDAAVMSITERASQETEKSAATKETTFAVGMGSKGTANHSVSSIDTTRTNVSQIAAPNHEGTTQGIEHYTVKDGCEAAQDGVSHTSEPTHANVVETTPPPLPTEDDPATRRDEYPREDTPRISHQYTEDSRSEIFTDANERLTAGARSSTSGISSRLSVQSSHHSPSDPDDTTTPPGPILTRIAQ